MQENSAFLTQQIITYIGNKRSLINDIESQVLKIKVELNKDRCVCADIFFFFFICRCGSCSRLPVPRSLPMWSG